MRDQPQGDFGYILFVWLMLVLVICYLAQDMRPQVRDLQRRVGQLEQEVEGLKEGQTR